MTPLAQVRRRLPGWHREMRENYRTGTHTRDDLAAQAWPHPRTGGWATGPPFGSGSSYGCKIGWGRSGFDSLEAAIRYADSSLALQAGIEAQRHLLDKAPFP